MEVYAAVGAGFRSMRLSQLFNDLACGASGVNFDGIYWNGMGYACVEPTCGDINLDVPNRQRFNCSAFGLIFNVNAEDSTTINSAVCCSQAPTGSCGNINPSTPNVTYPCPPGTEYDPATYSVVPATEANCCVEGTCANSKPISAPNTPFSCPSNSEFIPANGNLAPTETNCCKLLTCGDTTPLDNVNTPFACPNGTDFDPSMAGTSPPSAQACCKAGSCGNVKPITAPNTPFTCPDGYVFDPARNTTQPPSTINCCLLKTCGNVDPVANPNTPWTCPTNTEFIFSMSAQGPPSDVKCCKAGTCGNIFPVTRPNTTFQGCPPGFTYNPASYSFPISADNCCTIFSPTCGNTNSSVPNVPFDCAKFNQNDTTTNNTGIADVAIRKVVSPAIPGNPRISQTKTVGFVFTFTITGACCIKSTSSANCEDVLPGDCVGGTFSATASCEGTQCIPVEPDRGACCVTGLENAKMQCFRAPVLAFHPGLRTPPVVLPVIA
eukprot:gene12045-12188_t